MIIMGLDPGIKHTGWAILTPHGLIDSGTLTPQSALRGSHRQHWLITALIKTMQHHLPTHVIYEAFEWRRDGDYVQGRAEMERLIGGLQLLTLFCPYPAVDCVSPRIWGRDLLGTAQHTKEQIAWVVNQRLSTSFQGDHRDNHTCDAIGVALWLRDQLQREATLRRADTLAQRRKAVRP